MASDPQPLELTDILLSLDRHLDSRPISQTPDAPALDLDGPSRSTPEPPDEHELLEMRTRALSIRNEKGKAREDPLLEELVNMVVRLTAAAPARTQILDQAATIRRLSLQQEFLIQRMSDERASWEAERESTQRICEALIAQANIASHSLYKDQDSSKKLALIEAEATSLRHKLSDAQARASSLENELAQLRPLLLMQPSAVSQSKGLALKLLKKEDGSSVSLNNESRNYYRLREDKSSVDSSPSKVRKKRSTASYFKHAPTLADARSEHLLLAARKLGKERASLLSQSMYRIVEPQPQGPSTAPNHELTMHVKGGSGPSRPLMTPAVWSNPQGRHGRQQTVTPGPTKGQQNPPFSQYGPPFPQQYFVPSGTVARPGAPMPFYPAPPRGYIPGPGWPYYPSGPYAFAIQAPGGNAIGNTNSSKASQGRPTASPPVAGPSTTGGTTQGASALSAKRTSGKNVTSSEAQNQTSEDHPGTKTPQSKTAAMRNPPTPMDSLLSAAQTVFSPNSRQRSPLLNGDGSPMPKKRRRVESRSQQDQQAANMLDASNDLERRTSALDVLADQAAGVGSSQRSRSTSKGRRASSSSLSTNGKQAELASRTNSSTTRVNSTFASGKRTARGTVPRKGRRYVRASSIVPTLGTSASLASPTTQRAASEEHTFSSASAENLETSADIFKRRAAITSPSGRSSSVPRTGGGRGSAVRGRQTNDRPAVPLHPPSSRASPSVDTDIDAEGDEEEPEDNMDAGAEAESDAEVVSSQVNDVSRASEQRDEPLKRDKVVDPGEDADSRRWLEILGRRDS